MHTKRLAQLALFCGTIVISGCNSLGVQVVNPIFPKQNKVNDSYTYNYNSSRRHNPEDNKLYLAEIAAEDNSNALKVIAQRQAVPDNFGASRQTKQAQKLSNTPKRSNTKTLFNLFDHSEASAENVTSSSDRPTTLNKWLKERNGQDTPQKNRELAAFSREIDDRYQTKAIIPKEQKPAFTGEGTDLTRMVAPEKWSATSSDYASISYNYSDALDSEFEKVSAKPSFPPAANFVSNTKTNKATAQQTTTARVHSTSTKDTKPKAGTKTAVIPKVSKSSPHSLEKSKTTAPKQASHSSPSTGAPKGSRLRHPLSTGPTTGRHSITPSPYANSHHEEFSYYDGLEKVIELTNATAPQLISGALTPEWQVSYQQPIAEYLKGTSKF